MDDKVFNLLEKMYVELTEFKQETKAGLKEVNTRLTKIENTIENEMKPKINICLGELVSVKEKLTEHDTRFDTLGAQIETHDVEISVIKRIK